MLSSLTSAAVILLLVASGSAVLLVRDVSASHLRERIGAVRYRTDDQAPARPVPVHALPAAGYRLPPTGFAPIRCIVAATWAA